MSSAGMSLLVLFECIDAPTSLVKRRVLDLPENGVSIDCLLDAAESRLGFKIERSVQWLSSLNESPTPSPVAVLTDHALSVLLKSLKAQATPVAQGCFRFTAAPTSEPPAIPSNPGPKSSRLERSSCCGDSALHPAASPAPSSQPLNVIKVVLNGAPVTVEAPPPSRLLVDWLREDRGLTGTKIACGEGGCGACTVGVRPSGSTDPFVAINSCLRLLCACDGLDVLTTEGCGSDAQGFSAVQQAIADGNGSQCGFCTPGWVMNMETLLQQNPHPTRKEVEQQFDGNLCRCTGYRPILEAFKDLACGDSVAEVKVECRLDLNHCGDMEDIAGCEAAVVATKKSGCCRSKPANASTTTTTAGSVSSTVHVVDRSTGDEYWAPSNLPELALVLTALPDSSCQFRLVSGNTGMGVGKYFAHPMGSDDGAGNSCGQPPEGNGSTSKWVTVDVAKVREMRAVTAVEGAVEGHELVGAGTGPSSSPSPSSSSSSLSLRGGLSVGASVPINELIAALETHFVLPPPSPPAAAAVAPAVDSMAAVSSGDDSTSTHGLLGPSRDASEVYTGVVRHLKRVANTQVRGSGSWAGNLALTAKNQAFASDVALVFSALGVELEVMDQPSSDEVHSILARRVSVSEWLAEGTPAKKQVVVRGHFPGFLKAAATTKYFWYSDKTAQRHVNSHAISSFACLLQLNRSQCFPDWRDTLQACVVGPESKVVVGGVFAPAVRSCPEVVSAMQGGRVDRDLTLQKGLAALEELVSQARDSPPSSDNEDGGVGFGLSEDKQNSSEYRVALARTFLYKAFLTANARRLPRDLKSAAEPFAAAEDRPVSRGHQLFSAPSDGDPDAPVGVAVPKLSARLQASGEAKYPSDQLGGGKLFGSFVLSTRSRATLLGIDASQALTLPGVERLVAAGDVPGVNAIGTRGRVFVPVGKSAPFVGAPVALMVADTMKRARAAAKAVELTFADNDNGDDDGDEEGGEEEGATVVDLKAAKAEFLATSPIASRLGLRPRRTNNSCGKTVVDDGVSVLAGDPDAVFKQADASATTSAGDDEAEPPPASGFLLQSVVGGMSMCGQRHFHLETHCTAAVPDEDRRIVLTSGAQFPQATQTFVAKVLGLPVHRVEVKARRVGGAYGAKIVNNLNTATAAAVAAVALNKPVLLHNERVDDMTMLGGREGMAFRYRVAFEGGGGGSAGCISALDMSFSMDGGSSPTESVGDLNMCIDWCDGCYYVGNFRALGDLRFAARPTNTSCRAPGNLQSITCRELVNEHVAFEVGLPLHVVQERNLYAPGQVTPFGDVIGSSAINWTVPDLWRRCRVASGFDARLAAAHAFNAGNRFRKRGVAMVPTKYGMGPSGYKVGCIVNAFAADGTVEVFHSGVEMGQGIHTKVAQAVAMALGVDLSSVIVGDTSTALVPNGGCTGGSGTSESCVGAALEACAKLNATLEPFKAASKGESGKSKSQGSGDSAVSFADAAKAAAGEGLSLSATGWFNEASAHNGGSFDYFSQGVGMAEVEVDCLTGEVQILRCDIHMDLGQSLNPAVDIGQVEGGFVMALGYMLTEEVLYTSHRAKGSAQAYPDTPGSGRGHSRDQVQVNLGTWNYKVPSAFDIPQVLNVTLMPNTSNPSPAGVLGSKACGEPPMALAASVMLAVKQAVASCRKDALQRLRASAASNATYVEGHELSRYIEMDLPLTVERIQRACMVSDTRGALRLH